MNQHFELLTWKHLRSNQGCQLAKLCHIYSQKQGPSLSTTAFGRLGPFRFGLSGFSCIFFLRWFLCLGLTFSRLRGCGWGFIIITIIIMFFLLFPCLLDILFDTFVAEFKGDQVRDGTTDSNLLCLKLFVKPKMLVSMQDDSICDRWLDQLLLHWKMYLYTV